jgi:glycolate oxidase iron-sulfur subunit
MQTSLAAFISSTTEGETAEAILRRCVHCGFCNATCPTYQVLGNELDGPRGRIYLIKQMLEGESASEKTLQHLDRCLTCRNCETTCPSGVQYGQLVDIGRRVAEREIGRSRLERLARWSILRTFSSRFLTTAAMSVGRLFEPFLPRKLAELVPPARTVGPLPTTRHERVVLGLDGCVQPVAHPEINAATARVLSALGISLVTPSAGCCGAMAHHLSAAEDAHAQIKRNIDAWWPHIESGAEAIVMTASGCGAVVKEYGDILHGDPDYADKAKRVSEMTVDVAELLTDEPSLRDRLQPDQRRIAFHPPCSLQHAQKLPGIAERLLSSLGFDLSPVVDAHLCCGSAGTYSLLQPRLSEQLLVQKLSNLERGEPAIIATANIGCMMHLQRRAGRDVVHWISLIDEALDAAGTQ